MLSLTERSHFQKRAWAPSVVIPALNEARTIREPFGSVINAVNVFNGSSPIPAPANVYFVDNGSTDNTRDVVKSVVKDLTSPLQKNNFHLLSEPQRGTGHARRRGVAAAIRQRRELSPHGGSWIINTDSDVLVPEQWLTDWMNLFQLDNPGIIVGNIQLPDIDTTHPNAFKVMQAVGKKVLKAEEIFGVTNTHGNHFAIASDMYQAVGPFEQPIKVTPEGKIINVIGDDWDMGTKARALNLTLSHSPLAHTPVIASPRRFLDNPLGFLDGSIYNGEIQRVDAVTSSDIDISRFDQLVARIMFTECKYYISKPLLADSKLIDKPQVQQFLGHRVQVAIKKWIASNPGPNIFQDRNGFFSHVELFHEAFGTGINNLLLAHE